jgi:hypothetical protein
MVPLGSDVDWELDDASTATDLTIEPKDQRHWPWAGDEKPRGRHGRGERAKAHGAKMRRNARGTYQYNIQLSCPDGNGGTTTVTIDPGIIVH